MLKIFTLKYEEKSKSFNDSMLSNFLADKEILRWESHFFERKNEYFWTVLPIFRNLSSLISDVSLLIIFFTNVTINIHSILYLTRG